MRLFALVASAALLLSSSASAHVFDPQASFIYLQLGGLQGNSVGGQANAPVNATLTGGVGPETTTTIAQGMGFPTSSRPSVCPTARRSSGVHPPGTP